MVLQSHSFDSRGAGSGWVLEQARAMAEEDLVAEEAGRGWLPPCRIVSPLAGGGYSKEEYAMMERDRGKYLMYAAATREAVADLFEARRRERDGGDRDCDEVKIVVMVPGCGRGRLLQFVLDAVQAVNDGAGLDQEAASAAASAAASTAVSEADAKRPRRQRLVARVIGVDVNPIAVGHCRGRYAESISKGVVSIVGPVAIVPGMASSQLPPELRAEGPLAVLGRCDLIVSELLGSFADNEFMCAVTQTLRRLFLRPPCPPAAANTGRASVGSGGVLVPSRFACFACPAACPRARGLLAHLSSSRGAPLGSAAYIMSLTDGDTLFGAPTEVWRGRCDEPRRRWNGRHLGRLEVPLTHVPTHAPTHATIPRGSPVDCPSQGPALVDGLVGFFTSVLYGDIVVDSRPKLFRVGPSPKEVLSKVPSECDGAEASKSVTGGRNAMHWCVPQQRRRAS